MVDTADCGFVAHNLSPYVECMLDDTDIRHVAAHLKTCSACRNAVQKFELVHNILGEAGQMVVVGPKSEEQRLEFAPGILLRLSGAPWWLVSLAMHVLVIALASLVTMAIEMPKNNDMVIMLTELQPRPPNTEAEQTKKDPPETALLSQKDVPATDPNSKEASAIVVPPDILANAELSDHFETINPDLPDNHSAYGNDDARSFHSISGNSDAAGGGGTGGVGIEDLIGVGSGGTRGTGGGFGGGDGNGTGVQAGSGHGSFGQRNGSGRKVLVRRMGGSQATESAVERGLEWLAYHQEPDGSWNLQRDQSFGDLKQIDRKIGDVAATGYALLAFLGAGHTDRVGKYRENVKRGLDWLIGQLNDKTRWSTGWRSNYSQGIGTMALAEACAMNPANKDLHKAAQQAVNGVIEGQISTGPSEYQGWDYNPGGTTNDTSITGWNIMALKSAKVAGLHTDAASFEGAMHWIHVAQPLQNAPEDAEYWEGGECAYRGTLQNSGGLGDRLPTRMAIAAVTRLFIGGEKPTAPGVAGPCNLMSKGELLPTQWPGNLYYWYYGTLAEFQRGGDGWKKWNTALKKTLVENQRKDGDNAGSWDEGQNGLNTQYGGRVMSTALSCLCLEIYYRYKQLNDTH